MSNSNSKAANGGSAQSYPTPKQVTRKYKEETEEELVEKAHAFHKQSEKLEARFYDQSELYVVSSEWLARWKQYVGYDQVVAGQQPKVLLIGTQNIGKGRLPVLNEDIVDLENPIDVPLDSPYDYLNYALKDGLKENENYVLLDRESWSLLEDYESYELKRKMQKTLDGKKVEIYFRKMNVICLFNELLKNVETDRVTKFKRVRIQLPQYQPLEEALWKHFNEKLKIYVKEVLSKEYFRYSYSHTDYGFAPDPVKVWKIHDDMSQAKFLDHLMKGCKSCRSLSYRMYFPGTYIDLTNQAISQSELTPESTVVFQIKEKREDWIFFTKEHLISARCENCRCVQKLTVMCSCKDAAYCSKECKQKDKSIHRNRCERNAESSEEETQKRFDETSKRGRMGLKNLGNTCFMNSGIQCLTSVEEFTEYFLSGSYIKEINMSNPLGTKGELSRAYGKLVTKMWYDSDNSTAPAALKRAIGRFQPMFSGYEQHDSGELISYLLDGLHQDLNRVIKKPYVETKDYDGRPDDVIARESWANFLMRNRSEVVDLMYGQYRSKLDCPNCEKVSIIFDPFMTIPLPIPQDNRESLTVRFTCDNLVNYLLACSYDKDQNVGQLLKELATKIPGVQPTDRLVAADSNGYSYKFMHDKTFLSEFRYLRDISVRKLRPEEDVENGIKVQIHFTSPSTYGFSSTERRTFGHYTALFLSPTATCRQIHQYLFKIYGKATEIENYEQEIAENKEPKDMKWRVLLVNPAYYSYECPYCKGKNCKNCLLPYNDELTLANLTDKVRSYRANENVELEIYFQKNSDKAQKVLDTSERLTNASGAITIEDCFNLFEKPEFLEEENEWFCPQCKTLVKARKQLSIYKAPKILIINLKRFKSRGYKGLYKSKLETLVKFPLTDLDISKFVINHDLPTSEEAEPQKKNSTMQVEPKPLKYDLFAISNHFGSLTGGHYTAYCKKDNVWCEYDDSSVSPVGEEHLVSTSSYVLFYKRQDN